MTTKANTILTPIPLSQSKCILVGIVTTSGVPIATVGLKFYFSMVPSGLAGTAVGCCINVRKNIALWTSTCTRLKSLGKKVRNSGPPVIHDWRTGLKGAHWIARTGERNDTTNHGHGRWGDLGSARKTTEQMKNKGIHFSQYYLSKLMQFYFPIIECIFRKAVLRLTEYSFLSFCGGGGYEKDGSRLDVFYDALYRCNGSANCDYK
jgi:hypothetical protein